VWRIFGVLDAWLENYLRTKESTPHNYDQLGSDVVRISALVGTLDNDETKFLEWATKSNNEDGYYYYRTPENKQGLYAGKEHPECYPSVYTNLIRLTKDECVFDYTLNEYLLMEQAKISKLRLDELIERTCDMCETRFDTTDGMHRHKSRCKGDAKKTFAEKLKSPEYRGNYHGKGVGDWNGGTTTEW
jgi:hypothetical protein